MTRETYEAILEEIARIENPAALCICGECHFAWDDSKITSMTPVPGARCPNEYNH